MEWRELFSKEGENTGDLFGRSMAISGNYAIVGATGFPLNDSKGKAYIYQRQNDGKWKEVHTIEGENAGNQFGYSVAISGNYAIVGAFEFNGSAGKAYWYQRQNDGKWKEVHTIEGENGGDFFGDSVAISGNYAIVGAYTFTRVCWF